MSGVVNTIARLLVPDGAGRRALEETLADWRDERAGATSRLQALTIHLMAAAAVIRVVAALTRVEIVRRDAWRWVGYSVLATLIAIVGIRIVGYAPRLPVRLAVPGALASLFPPMVAFGLGLRPDWPRPILGGLALSTLLLVLLAGWVAPATLRSYRASTAESEGIDPDAPDPAAAGPRAALMPDELFLPQLVRVVATGSGDRQAFARALLGLMVAKVLAGPTFLVFGEVVRRRVSRRRSWRVAQMASGALGLVLLGAGAWAWPLFRPLQPWLAAVSVERLTIEKLLLLAIVWSITFLAMRSLSSSPEPKLPTSTWP